MHKPDDVLDDLYYKMMLHERSAREIRVALNDERMVLHKMHDELLELRDALMEQTRMMHVKHMVHGVHNQGR